MSEYLEMQSAERLEAMNLVGQAETLMMAGQHPEAFARMEEAQKVDPMYIDAYAVYAKMLIGVDQYDKALEQLEKAEMIDKKDGRIYAFRGSIYFLQNEFGKALEQLARAEEYGEKTARVAANTAYCYEMMGETDRALSAYARAIRRDPEAALYYVRRTRLLMNSGKLEAAEEAAADLIQRFPYIREGYDLAVDILLEQKKPDEAETMLNNFLEAMPEDESLQNLLMYVYAVQGRYEEASAMGEAIMAKEHVDEEVLKDAAMRLAQVYLAAEKVDKAVELLNKLVAAETDEVNVEARTMLMAALASKKCYDQLLPAAEAALKTDAADTALYVAYMYKPLAMQNLGRENEARVAYQEGIRRLRMVSIRNPQSALDSHMYRAMCYYGLKQYNDALHELKFFEDMKVEKSEFYAFRAMVYEGKGDLIRAKADQEKAMQLRQNG